MSTKILEHNGFQGSLEFSLENNILYGKILNIDDLVSYEADDVNGLMSAFKEAIEDYLETCNQLGVEPNRPFSGSFNIRIGKSLHREAVKQAAREGKSLNDLIKDAIDCHVNGRHQQIHHHYEERRAYEAEYFIAEAPRASRVTLRSVQ